MAKKLHCPNCSAVVAKHPENGCILAAMIQVIRDRGSMSERKLRSLHAGIDSDAWWTAVGEVIDDIEEGRFQNQPNRNYPA